MDSLFTSSELTENVNEVFPDERDADGLSVCEKTNVGIDKNKISERNFMKIINLTI